MPRPSRAARSPAGRATLLPSARCSQSGADSPILEWEKKYVNDQGALSNPELSQVVEAMSYFQVSMPDPAQQAMSG